ncbi:prepilin-type N-terminal cleavage/methylation domain-containing protein [Campylobacter sp. JMF_01 NE2]|uniref:prepilin-type N-terminal cleavage/methylation domain-containing protein n=1 Tax=unclassified Campylobacter TaxID=2593542 RepID=UPI0022E9B51D|nr:MULTISPECIES: prepilin-type N-terminal cleavage/methylation domain-containing protein [unclassified Campylobacter]MDA3053046.1 prepilin-type N-terminal cleavage/methylation domain-containing protein [Campylobacter sp. JMF_03 NE3]MDA3067377.1 prepilin-type N-terminal cleavage/methylation domain-containing protein [Campylobacter sp. JMF_01 NE2]
MKKGFTLIELVMVIVILGIISMFGADLYSQIYKSYVHTRALNQLESRTQNAITLISNRLEYRVYGSVVSRKLGKPINEFINLAAAPVQNDVVEWIGQSIETKDINSSKPGWSGFMDMSSVSLSFDSTDNSTNSVLTQGSVLSAVSGIVSNLTCATRGCKNGRYNDFAVIFGNLANDYSGTNIITAYGYKGTNNDDDKVYIAKARVGNSDENLTITSYHYYWNGTENVREFSEQYYLVHSAYAIYPTDVKDVNYGGQTGKNFNLTLAYNYRPWEGETYNGTGANAPKVSLIAEDVSTFLYRDIMGSIQMKLCMRDNGRNFDPEQLDMIMCKSQVVY